MLQAVRYIFETCYAVDSQKLVYRFYWPESNKYQLLESLKQSAEAATGGVL